MLTIKLTAVTAIVMLALAAGPVEAKAPRSLSCSSLGLMGGNPKSLQIANRDETGSTIRAGTTFSWQMSPSGQTGVVTLQADMKPGKTLVLDNALKGPIDQNVDCKIV
jgi:hypothetical protein